MEMGNDERVISIAQDIKNLETNESYEYLLNTLRSQRMFNKPLINPGGLCQQLCSHLVNYANKESVQTILMMVEMGIVEVEFAAPILEKMTNISVRKDKQTDNLVARYEFWMDSLKTMEDIRDFGYRQEINFAKSFFHHKVDYYGMVLSRADSLPRIRHNALKDIVATQHPRALFYIAALAWRYRNDTSIEKAPEVFVALLEKLADLKIAIEGKKEVSPKHDWANDELASLNHLKYWANNYDDYEWDGLRKSFMNKEEAIELKESYERLFRRLNSQNDSVALNAYLFLVEGDPVEVMGLSRKYKELLRNYNASLPSFKHGFLEQLVQLTDFSRRIGAHYRPPHRLNQLLHQLSKSTDPKERYLIENQIIDRLAPDEVTALEFWGCIHEGDPENAFSVGRILDWFYSKNWDRIIENDEELRFYLKKAYLFKNIGVEGICKVYLNKFDQTPDSFKERLEEILKTESDQDIIFQIKELLARIRGGHSGTLTDFLQSPDWFSPLEISRLPEPDEAFYQKIIAKIEGSTSKYHQKAWLQYLQKNPSLHLSPHLFKWLERGISTPTLVKVLEKTFDYKLKEGANAWKTLWQTDSAQYQAWPKRFFEERLANLAKDQKQNIKEINAVVQSDFYKPEYKTLCLNALLKVKPVRNIPRLRMENMLSVEEDLNKFDEIDFGYKYLDDLPKLFDLTNDAPTMIAWLSQKAKDFDLTEKGSFYNNLFQKNWFFEYVNDGQIVDSLAQEAKNALLAYLHESEFISEFEEQATTRNIALLDNLGKSLEEKIESTLGLDVDENSKASIEKAILSRIDYKDIPTVTKYFNELSILKQYNFLNHDFGLPIFNLADNTVQVTLLDNFKNMEPVELYTYYLEAFKVDFRTEEGDLDFNKIYQILQYDIVMPFVGSGGKKRDLYTYGIIKLLELHFQTRLGFHEKLNENQTFYTYTASKRAHAWMNYLVENDHVNLHDNLTPSFNAMVRE